MRAVPPRDVPIVFCARCGGVRTGATGGLIKSCKEMARDSVEGRKKRPTSGSGAWLCRGRRTKTWPKLAGTQRQDLLTCSLRIRLAGFQPSHNRCTAWVSVSTGVLWMLYRNWKAYEFIGW